MTIIGFLHTAGVHVPVFRSLLAELAPATREVHVVDPTLLADAGTEGLTPGLAGRVDQRLAELTAAGAEMILCTCSSIGGVAERAAGRLGVPVLRADRPMAEAAVAAGPRIAVVCAVDSTLAPTRALLTEAAAGTPLTLIDVRCPAAWPAFEAGDLDGYATQVAAAARRAAPGADVIVLAQASMAPAADRLADLPIPVLASPRTAVARIAGSLEPGEDLQGLRQL